MSDLLRVTGMYSGIDTESIVSQLVSAKSVKVTKLKNEQTKHEWKQNVWQELNSKIYSLYSKTLSKMRLTGSYKQKSTVSSDTTKATVVASENAVNGTQTLKVNQLAKSGYLTGAKLEQKKTTETITQEDGSTTTKDKYTNWTSADKLSDINSDLTGKSITISVGVGDEAKDTTIDITSDMTIAQFTNKLAAAGVNASFDETNQRFFISSKSTGAANEFTLSGDTDALQALGIDENGTYNNTSCTRIKAQDAKIVLNDATFTSDTNTFSVNGLTINAVGVTDDEISIVTSTDYDGVYNMIKDFISEYNEVINEVCKRYNADSASDYDVLSDDEKASMTDEQIENWENKIKDSLLRRDGTLYSVMNAMTSIMSSSVEVNGEKKFLFDYGIETLSYFDAEDNEHYAYHIDGDEDDENTAEKDDKLKAAIATDPDGVAEFFAGMCKNLYTKLGDLMARSEYSSIYKVYDDKRMETEYNDYTTKIKKAEQELSDYEDKWYDKFTAMEVALSKLQSNSSAITNMLGTS